MTGVQTCALPIYFDSKKLNYIKAKVEQPTGTVNISLDKNGIPQYEIKKGVAWDYIPFTPELEALAMNTSVVCFGSLAQRSEQSRLTINRFIETMPQHDSRYVIFDINLRQQFYNESILRNSIQKCNILKINDEELEIVSKLFDYNESTQKEQCLRLLKEFGLKMLILTCGTKGSYVFNQDLISFVGTPLVEVADTVGAGDSFTATFISAILHGKSIAAAHQLAVDVSAYVRSEERRVGKECVSTC